MAPQPMAAGSSVEDIDNEEILAILFRHRDGAVDPPVDTVVLELVDQVVERPERVVAVRDSQTRLGTRAFQYDRSHQCPTVPAWFVLVGLKLSQTYGLYSKHACGPQKGPHPATSTRAPEPRGKRVTWARRICARAVPFTSS